jgi:hypothetical protein
MKILFLHGWNSIPGGVKPTFLAQHGHKVFNPKLPDGDFEEAVRIAQDEFDKHQPDVIGGSSRGGAVAMKIVSGNAKLVLLWPGKSTGLPGSSSKYEHPALKGRRRGTLRRFRGTG